MEETSSQDTPGSLVEPGLEIVNEIDISYSDVNESVEIFTGYDGSIVFIILLME